MPFQYKCVLLVGATSGIGAGMADKLVAEGSHVIAVGRRQDRLDAFVQKHGSDKASAIRFDITDTAGLDAFVASVVEKYPNLDCVFLNSGTQSQIRLSRPAEVDLAAFHSEMNVNFTCIVNLSIKFLPHLQAKPATTPTALIFTGTLLSLVPAVTLPAYSASKTALSVFVDCLRAQSVGKSTKVIEVLPPVVQTELHDYMGLERGRSLGMSLDVFTNQAYDELVTGKEIIYVGTLGLPGTIDRKEVLDLADRRRSIMDTLSKMLLSYFQL